MIVIAIFFMCASVISSDVDTLKNKFGKFIFLCLKSLKHRVRRINTQSSISYYFCEKKNVKKFFKSNIFRGQITIY
jgi:hypothetical protein